MDRLIVRGGIRVVPRTGGGVRADAGWPLARLTADHDTVGLENLWAGSLTVTRDRPCSISAWRYGLNRGVLFDVTDLDELWIFRTPRPRLVLTRLARLGWPADRASPQPPPSTARLPHD